MATLRLRLPMLAGCGRFASGCLRSRLFARCRGLRVLVADRLRTRLLMWYRRLRSLMWRLHRATIASRCLSGTTFVSGCLQGCAAAVRCFAISVGCFDNATVVAVGRARVLRALRRCDHAGVRCRGSGDRVRPLEAARMLGGENSGPAPIGLEALGGIVHRLLALLRLHGRRLEPPLVGI